MARSSRGVTQRRPSAWDIKSIAGAFASRTPHLQCEAV
jgi:hypothetical protein